jgi:hypothetical protein
MAWALGANSAETHVQAWSALSWDNGNGGRAKVQSNGVVAHHVFGLVRGNARERQLHKVPLALSIGPLGTRTTGLALYQPGIFDAMGQPVSDHRVLPVDHGGQPIVLPQEISNIALLRRLEHESQPGIVALVLDTPKAPPPAFEAHPAGLSRA